MKLLLHQNPARILMRPLAALQNRLALLVGWKRGAQAMASIAERAELAHCVWPDRWGVQLHAAVGLRRGFIVYIGPPLEYWRPGAGRVVEVRFQSLGNERDLQAATAQVVSAMPDQPSFEVGRDFVRVWWPLYRPCPAPWRLAKLARDLVALLKETTVPLEEKCEFCGKDPRYSLLLVDRKPVLCCESCQVRIQEEAETAERTYLFRQGDSFRAVCFSLPFCVVGGVMWGAAMMFFLTSFTVASTVFLGIAIAWAVARGRRKAGGVTLILSLFLTLFALLTGAELWYLPVSFYSAGLPAWYGRLEVFEWGRLVLSSLFFGFTGAWAMTATMRPRFRPELELLPLPAESSPAAPARSHTQVAGQTQ